VSPLRRWPGQPADASSGARIRRGPGTGNGRARSIWSACAVGLRSGQGLERRPAFPPTSSASAQKATLCSPGCGVTRRPMPPLRCPRRLHRRRGTRPARKGQRVDSSPELTGYCLRLRRRRLGRRRDGSERARRPARRGPYSPKMPASCLTADSLVIRGRQPSSAVRLTLPGCAHDGDAAVSRSGLCAGLRAYERAVYRLFDNSA